MTCVLCDDVGLISLGANRVADGYQQIAVCLCVRGQHLRRQIDRGLYALLAKIHDLQIEDIGLIEEMIDPKDIPPSLRPKAAFDIGAAGQKLGRAKL